jgi:hypothetical protein
MPGFQDSGGADRVHVVPVGYALGKKSGRIDILGILGCLLDHFFE